MYTNSIQRPQRGYGPRIPRGHAMSRPQVGSDSRLSDRMESRDGSNARHFQQLPLGAPHHHQGAYNQPMAPSYDTRLSYNSHNRGYQNPNQMLPPAIPESPTSSSHEDNVKYVHEDWLKVENEFRKSNSNPDGSAGQVQIYQEKVPNRQLDAFRPFDFDQWYASYSGKQQ